MVVFVQPSHIERTQETINHFLDHKADLSILRDSHNMVYRFEFLLGHLKEPLKHLGPQFYKLFQKLGKCWQLLGLYVEFLFYVMIEVHELYELKPSKSLIQELFLSFY